MRTLVVVFSILLGILLLISALGGSLNSTEKFEDYGLVEGDEAETFYDPTVPPTTKDEKKPMSTPPTPPATLPPPPAHTTPTAEAFQNSPEDIEPYEDPKQVPSFATLSSS